MCKCAFYKQSLFRLYRHDYLNLMFAIQVKRTALFVVVKLDWWLSFRIPM